MIGNEKDISRIQTVCLMVLAVVAATYSIYWLRPVLVPLVVALFVVSGITPVLNSLERRLGVNRIVAAGLTFLAGLVVLLIFGLSIWVSIGDLQRNSSDYRGRVQEIVNQVEKRFERIVTKMEDSVASIFPAKKESDEEPRGTETGEIENGWRRIR